MNKIKLNYMKKQISYLLTLFAVVLLATACHSEKVDYGISQEGQLNLSSLQLTPNTDPLVTESRVAAELSDYIVEIYTEGGDLVNSWKYSEMPEVYTLKVGKYKVVAHAPVTTGAAFDTPYCEGESKVFEITQDNLTNLGEIACTLHNVKVTIKYADNLKPLLGEDVKVTVKVGGESLEYGKDETRSGFFHCEDNNTVDVIFSGTVDGAVENVTKSYMDVALGTELIVTYNLIDAVFVDPGTGGTISAGGLKLDATCIPVTIEGFVRPTEDEILDFGLPSVVGEGFDLSQPVTDLSQKVVVDLMAPEGAAHIWVEIISDNEDFNNVIRQMFPQNPFDLAEPGEAEAQLNTLGLPIKDAVIGKDVVVFDVSQFVGLLGGFPGLHQFKLTVEDVNGDTANAILTIDSRSAQ